MLKNFMTFLQDVQKLRAVHFLRPPARAYIDGRIGTGSLPEEVGGLRRYNHMKKVSYRSCSDNGSSKMPADVCYPPQGFTVAVADIYRTI